MSLGADMLPMLTEIGMKCLEGGLNRLRPFFPKDAEYVNPNQAEVVNLVAITESQRSWASENERAP